MFSDPSLVAYCNTSSSAISRAASTSLILRSLPSTSLVTSLLLASFFLRILTATATCVYPPLPEIPAALHCAFPSSSIFSPSRCLFITNVLHSSLQKRASLITYFIARHIVEVASYDPLQLANFAIMHVHPLLSLPQYVMTSHLWFFVVCDPVYSWNLRCSISKDCRVRCSRCHRVAHSIFGIIYYEEVCALTPATKLYAVICDHFPVLHTGYHDLGASCSLLWVS